MTPDNRMMAFEPGRKIGESDWISVGQDMISGFGHLTLDPDPMHINPEWARQNGSFGGTIAFGFLTASLLTHMLYSAMGRDPYADAGQSGHYLNYGFDRLRFVAPVRAGQRIRGHFSMKSLEKDDKNRWLATFDCTVEIEGEEKPALVGQWLSIWVPPENG